jgi:hypothetical protein
MLVHDVDEIPNGLKMKLKDPNQEEDNSVFKILKNNNENASNIL